MSLKRYFIKKSVAQIQEESQSGHLKRTLGPWNLISLGIGCLIGAGIFVITGEAAAAHAGPAITLSFVLAGIACAFTGLCYAELASVLPISGSAYTYAYATLGELLAWVMGWLLILEYGLSASTVAVGWSGYVVSFLGNNLGITIPPEFTIAYGVEKILTDGTTVTGIFNVPAFLGILAVTTLLVIGISESATVNNVIVVIKVLVILAFVLIGCAYINVDNWTPYIPESAGPDKYGYDGILRGAGMVFFAYIGFEAVSTAAQEAKNPQRDMPIGILGSLAVCTLLYIIVSGVLTGIVHYSELGVPDPMAVAVDKIGLGWFSVIIKIGAIMGLSSVMLVTMYGQTRVFFVMSRDGLLPDLFSRVHPKFRTPHLNTMLVGGIVSIAAGLTPISTLGALCSMGTLAAFAVVCFSVLYLRYTQPDLERPFRTPFMPVVPICGILACCYLIYGLGWDTILKLKIWLIGGLVVYFAYSQFKSKLYREGDTHSTPSGPIIHG